MKKLPMSPPPDEPEPRESPSERPLEQASPETVIRAGVLAALGRPPGLYRVAVMPLWGSYYRVNVLVGADVTSALIAHSYFVEAGDDRTILTATPLVTRRYP